MALKPIGWMTAASAACGLVLMAVIGPEQGTAVLLGMLGPLVSAAGTWVIVERTYATAPGRVNRIMIQLFAVKMLLIGGYVASVVLLRPAGAIAFGVSFACQYIMLHMMEAAYLRRLFAGGREPLGAR
ncbi:MAG TPA: hypothetical protein VLD67_07015 [Vicinamibacterales bacterium]|nr:hypothetical protein [Vicinamibacterales bacterium]